MSSFERLDSGAADVASARGAPDPGDRTESDSIVLDYSRGTVAVVDDDPSVLRSLVRLLVIDGFDVAPFDSADALLAGIETLAPACVIADLSMPNLTGLDLQRALDEHGFRFPIVFLTAHGDIRSCVQAMRGGAVDFLTKPLVHSELLDAIERAIARSSRSREAAEDIAEVQGRIASLTKRELEVFEQVVAGFLNKQIAANLGISEKTVKVHRARVMRKMSVKSLAQLARVAERIGIDRAARELPLER